MPNAFEHWRIVRILGKQHYLLASLLILLFVFPLVTNEPELRRLSINVALALIIITGPLSLAAKRTEFVIAVGLAALTWLPRWAALVTPHATLPNIIGSAAAAAFFGYLGTLVYKMHLLEVRTVSRETVLAAINAYLCVGLMFAFIYVNLEVAFPNAFQGELMDRSPSDTVDGFIYFSFVTMTTLGYGDLTPTSLLAGTFAYTEALLGQLYVATTIARVVGIQVAQTSEHPTPS